MPSFTLSPNTFVASTAGNSAVATGTGTSWTSGLTLTCPGLTITVLSVDAMAQTVRLSITAGNTPGPFVVTDGLLYSAVEVTPFGSLITLDYALAQFAAGDRILSAAQAAALPSKIVEASAYVRRWCGDRDFTRQVYTETHRPGQDGRIGLAQLPVNRVLRVSRSPADALTISADGSACQIANVGFATSGDYASGLVVTGLAFDWVASGVESTATILYASLATPTIASLTTAINALGSPWSAVADLTLGAWPASELIGLESSRGAIGGAVLQVYSEDVQDARIERSTGLLWAGQPGLSDGFGPRWGPDWGLWSDQVLPEGRVRVKYDAGFDVIPGPVQQATAIIAIALVDKLAINSSLDEVDLGNTRFGLFSAETVSAIPKAARDYLAPYRIVRV